MPRPRFFMVFGLFFCFACTRQGADKKEVGDRPEVRQAEQKKQPQKGIDPATVAAYEKLEATYGGQVHDSFRYLRFEAGTKAAEAGLPGFRFNREPQVELPAVSVPFSLEFPPGTLTDGSIQHLANLKNLTSLSLPGTKVTAAGLKRLAGLTNLIRLDYPDRLVTDSTLQTLKEIGLTHTLTSVVNLDWLVTPRNSREVISLDLQATQASDAGLKEVLHCNKLQSLKLKGPQITEASLKALAGFKSLSSLSLDDAPLTKVVLKDLGGLKHLSRLSLRGTKLTDEGMKDLAGLENLKDLDLTDTRVTGTGLRELARCKLLSILTLPPIDDGMLRGLREIDLLHALLQAHGTGPSDFARAKSADTVYRLDLNSIHVTDKGLKELVSCKNLVILSLRGTSITDAGLKELTPLTRLGSLYLEGTKVTPEGIEMLRKVLPGLQVLQ